MVLSHRVSKVTNLEKINYTQFKRKVIELRLVKKDLRDNKYVYVTVATADIDLSLLLSESAT